MSSVIKKANDLCSAPLLFYNLQSHAFSLVTQLKVEKLSKLCFVSTPKLLILVKVPQKKIAHSPDESSFLFEGKRNLFKPCGSSMISIFRFINLMNLNYLQINLITLQH